MTETARQFDPERKRFVQERMFEQLLAHNFNTALNFATKVKLSIPEQVVVDHYDALLSKPAIYLRNTLNFIDRIVEQTGISIPKEMLERHGRAALFTEDYDTAMGMLELAGVRVSKRTLIKMASARLERRYYSEAAELFQQADHKPGLRKVARMLLNVGYMQDAERVFKKSGKTPTYALKALARHCERRREYKRAYDMCTENDIPLPRGFIGRMKRLCQRRLENDPQRAQAAQVLRAHGIPVPSVSYQAIGDDHLARGEENAALNMYVMLTHRPRKKILGLVEKHMESGSVQFAEQAAQSIGYTIPNDQYLRYIERTIDQLGYKLSHTNHYWQGMFHAIKAVEPHIPKELWLKIAEHTDGKPAFSALISAEELGTPAHYITCAEYFIKQQDRVNQERAKIAFQVAARLEWEAIQKPTTDDAENVSSP